MLDDLLEFLFGAFLEFALDELSGDFLDLCVGWFDFLKIICWILRCLFCWMICWICVLGEFSDALSGFPLYDLFDFASGVCFPSRAGEFVWFLLDGLLDFPLTGLFCCRFCFCARLFFGVYCLQYFQCWFYLCFICCCRCCCVCVCVCVCICFC